MANPKLSTAEKAALIDMIQEEGWDTLLKIMSDIYSEMENRVLTSPVESDSEERKLFIYKCQCDGARKLVKALDKRIHDIRLEASNSTRQVSKPVSN